MTVRRIRLADVIASRLPGAPYFAWSGTVKNSGVYRPDYIELYGITSGEGLRVTSSRDGTARVHPFRAGELYLFRPIDTHELYSARSGDFGVATVAFPLASWERFVTMAELDRTWISTPAPPMVTFDPDDPAVLAPFQRALEKFHNGATPMDLIEFLVATIPWFIPRGQLVDRSGSPTWLWSAIVAMQEEENLRGGFDRLVELSHVSPGHLWRSTRRYFGTAPAELVSGIQLNHAAMLLVSSDEGIASIAERCGFPTASHFSWAFRKRYSVTPREFRARAKRGR